LHETLSNNFNAFLVFDHHVGAIVDAFALEDEVTIVRRVVLVLQAAVYEPLALIWNFFEALSQWIEHIVRHRHHLWHARELHLHLRT